MSLLTAPRLHQALLAVPLAVTGVSIGTFGNKSTYLVQPTSLQSAAQATINAFDDSPTGDAAYLNQLGRDQAVDAIDNDRTSHWKAERAAAAVLVDEINLLRDWNTGLASAVAAATSLADLKTRVALLPALPDRTLSQAKTAIQNKITSGVVD
jgi:hypothetical protein